MTGSKHDVPLGLSFWTPSVLAVRGLVYAVRMLRVLTDFFQSLQSPQTSADGPEQRHTLELATGVLLIEVVRADGRLDDAEVQAVMDALRSKFALSAQDLAGLYELAHQRSEDAHDLYSFTERLNAAFDEPQRIRVFELLWTVAYADGHADAHEVHLLRRIADLLHIRHGDAIAAKLRAERARPSA
jgi:uncharacterized tellurite resistance protein B-like protein